MAAATDPTTSRWTNAFWAGVVPCATVAGDAVKDSGPRTTKLPMKSASKADRTPTQRTSTMRRAAVPRLLPPVTTTAEHNKPPIACKYQKLVVRKLKFV